MVALAEVERRSSSPLPLPAIPSPVSVTWPRTGYGNKAFTGREWDPETGLYYYRARYYDPEIGRFISEDPIKYDGGLNFYAYVENNPINWIDPSGEIKIPPGIARRIMERALQIIMAIEGRRMPQIEEIARKLEKGHRVEEVIKKGSKLKKGVKGAACIVAPPIPGIEEVIEEIIDVVIPEPPERADPVVPRVPSA